jgi:DNA processing protein
VTAAAGYRPADRREVAAWLALLAAPGLRGETLVQLVAETGGARAAFDALEDALGAEVAAEARTGQVQERTRRALHATEQQDLHVIPFTDPAYPRLLTERLGAYRPPVLFGRGDLSLFALAGIGIVGCRSASEYGLDVAEDLADAVARAGGCVVSGVALGIDAAAHQAALDAGGATIGVLACGVDVFYPRRNMQLQERIATTGLLLSENLPGEAPRKYLFPYRNRIIACLSRAVVVVEGGARSGTLSTAEHAGQRGVDVFAVPHPLDRPNGEGILRLYRDGVPPYTGARDLLHHAGLIALAEAAPREPDVVAHAPPEPRAAQLWQELGPRGRTVDELAAASGIPVPEVLVLLLQMELGGYASQLAGGRFTRRKEPRLKLRKLEQHALPSRFRNREAVAG